MESDPHGKCLLHGPQNRSFHQWILAKPRRKMAKRVPSHNLCGTQVFAFGIVTHLFPRTYTRESQREPQHWHARMWAALPFLYPPPASAFVTAMSVVSFASLASLGLSELRGDHLAYSKFWNVKNQQQAGGRAHGRLLSSRDGMLVVYAPALAAALASFAVPGVVDGLRAQLLAAALAVHFFKRVAEVLFIHQYSGNMPLNTALTISSSYLSCTMTMIYTQYLSNSMPEPTIDLTYIGVLVFVVGIAGNFYHHCLLSRLREEGEKGYKMPRGGLFQLVTCPHYLFEIAGFFGFFLISQTVYALSMASGTMIYLLGRSYATRKWYMSKFENFPTRIRALIPYIW